MRCPTCGAENDAGDRFCAECGSQLPAARDLDPTSEQQPNIPPQYPTPERDGSAAPTSAAGASTSDNEDADWRMSSLGPPPRPPRRIWLWVLMGIVGSLVLCCVVFWVVINFTDAGQSFVEEIEAEATRQAGGDPDEAATPATPAATPEATPATPEATPATPETNPAPNGTPGALRPTSIAGP